MEKHSHKVTSDTLEKIRNKLVAYQSSKGVVNYLFKVYGTFPTEYIIVIKKNGSKCFLILEKKRIKIKKILSFPFISHLGIVGVGKLFCSP